MDGFCVPFSVPIPIFPPLPSASLCSVLAPEFASPSSLGRRVLFGSLELDIERKGRPVAGWFCSERTFAPAPSLSYRPSSPSCPSLFHTLHGSASAGTSKDRLTAQQESVISKNQGKRGNQSAKSKSCHIASRCCSFPPPPLPHPHISSTTPFIFAVFHPMSTTYME